jgi:hypothetical protein
MNNETSTTAKPIRFDRSEPILHPRDILNQVADAISTLGDNDLELEDFESGYLTAMLDIMDSWDRLPAIIRRRLLD